MLFSTVAVPTYMPTNSALGSLTVPLCCFLTFKNSHSNRFEVTPHTVVLICVTLVISDVEYFSCTLSFLCLLWKNVYSGPLLILFIYFLLLGSLYEFFIYFGY